MAQGLFMVGPGAGPYPTRIRQVPKMPSAPSAFPLLGAPQALGDKPNPPEGGKSQGGRPPETEGY